ncbi:MAG: DNA repair protein RecO [Tannerella sp.]|nr:DNA repair protein RecO [Tannerella sp.]
MLYTTRGIILHTMPYNDKYVIVHAYTEISGRMSYLVARARSRKSKVSHALFMPLSVLEMEVDHSHNRDLQRIKETRISFPLNNIAFHPVKNVIALFTSEVIYRSVRTKEADPKLFGFLHDSIRWLDISEEGVANFHLVFLIHLVRYFGVFPNVDNYHPGYFFDLLNGVFASLPPEHKHYLDETESVIFSRLLRMNYENMAVYSFSRQERTNIIRRVLEYYRLHLSDFPEIKSLSVMQHLFD